MIVNARASRIAGVDKRVVEVALADVLDDRRGHDLRLAVDVAADDRRRPDLRDRVPKAGHGGGKERNASLDPQPPDELGCVGPERPQLIRQLRRQRLKTRHRDPGDERAGDQHLGNDHPAQGVDQLQVAERTASPEQQGHDQPDHDSGHRHAGVDGGRQHAATPATPEREPGAEGDAERERDRRRAQRNERRPAKHLMNRVHQPSASATKSGSPYSATPKRPISRWVFGETIQSENS